MPVCYVCSLLMENMDLCICKLKWSNRKGIVALYQEKENFDSLGLGHSNIMLISACFPDKTHPFAVDNDAH